MAFPFFGSSTVLQDIPQKEHQEPHDGILHGSSIGAAFGPLPLLSRNYARHTIPSVRFRTFGRKRPVVAKTRKIDRLERGLIDSRKWIVCWGAGTQGVKEALESALCSVSNKYRRDLCASARSPSGGADNLASN
jgi:hypothetical protein